MCSGLVLLEVTHILQDYFTDTEAIIQVAPRQA